MAFIISMFVVPVALLLYFGVRKPKYIWLTIVICPIVDFLSLYDYFMYYESKGLMIVFTVLQALVVSILAAVIWKLRRPK